MKSLKKSQDHFHFPVMLPEVIKACSPNNGGSFVDCTFGGGGYSREILKFPNTKVIALDRDSHVKDKAQKIKEQYLDRFSFFNERFSNLDRVIKKEDKVDAIIFDLGLSSFQLLDLSRGFSFKSKDKIDMSMGLTKLSAEQVLNEYDEDYLKIILKTFGEENEASRISRNIVKARSIKKISTVSELVKIIEDSKKKDYSKKK